MQPTTRRTVPVITTDGTGEVSHAGTVLLAELADRIGLTALLSEATDGLRERRAGASDCPNRKSQISMIINCRSRPNVGSRA